MSSSNSNDIARTESLITKTTTILNITYKFLVNTADFSPKSVYTEYAVIFVVTVAGVLIPLFIVKKFGKLLVLKYFCA